MADVVDEYVAEEKVRSDLLCQLADPRLLCKSVEDNF